MCEIINYIRESKHIKTLERQTLKFNQLGHKNTGGWSNIHHGEHGDHDHKQQHGRAIITPVSEKSDVQKAKLVINISSKPLTTVQENLLAHGSNFAVVLTGPPYWNVLQW